MTATNAAALDEAGLSALEASFRGELVRPDDTGYDDAPKGLERIDRPPARR